MISILDLQKHRGACKWTLFAAALVLMLLVQAISLRGKVLRVEASEYSDVAVELEVTSHWRYGYVTAYHGARLVRTPNVPLQVRQFDPASGDVGAAMDKELHLVPRKAALETALYLFLLFYGFFVAPWAAESNPVGIFSRIRHAGFVAVLWVQGWTFLAAPAVLWGYGEPIYSTWSGPGALSSSGPYLCSLSSGPGMTVSYRGVFEAAAPCYSAMLVEATSLPEHLPEMSDTKYLWLLGVISYGILGPIWQFAIRKAFLPRDPPICQTCNVFVDLPAQQESRAMKCSCGRTAAEVYPIIGAVLAGLATSIGWILLVAALLDAADLEGKTRIAIVILMVLAAMAYGSMEIRNAFLYRRAPYPASTLARSHFGVGAGVLFLPALGLIAWLLL
jgi:hypothetical protein